MAKKETSIEQNNTIVDNNRDELEEVQYMFQNVNYWINFADNKIGIFSSIMFAIYSIIGIYMINYISSISNYEENPILKLLAIIFFGLSVLCFFATFIVVVVAIKPRWIGKKYSPQRRNSFFYADVALYKNKEEFIEIARKESRDERINQIMEEIYINSGICKKKMMCLSVIPILLFVTISLNLISIFFSIIAG